jgi:hypothetical protein
MAVRRRARKLFYPAGIISLSILPLLCVGVFYQTELHRRSQHVLEVTYWDEGTPETPAPKSANHRFMKINLTGSADDVAKLEFFQATVRELVTKKDSTTEIEVVLNSGARYASLVRLYDICERERAQRYFHLRDKFWVFSLAPSLIERPYFRCGTGRATDDFARNHPSYLRSFLYDHPVMVTVSSVLFILLIGLASGLRTYVYERAYPHEQRRK